MAPDGDQMFDSALSAWPVWRHRKGGVYTVVGHQRGLVFYVAHADGKLWYRPDSEFMDGRFTPLYSEYALSPEEAGFNRG